MTLRTVFFGILKVLLFLVLWVVMLVVIVIGSHRLVPLSPEHRALAASAVDTLFQLDGLMEEKDPVAIKGVLRATGVKVDAWLAENPGTMALHRMMKWISSRCHDAESRNPSKPDDVRALRYDAEISSNLAARINSPRPPVYDDEPESTASSVGYLLVSGALTVGIFRLFRRRKKVIR